MTTVAQLVTKLEADTKDFRAGMIMSKKMVEDFKKSMGSLADQVEKDNKRIKQSGDSMVKTLTNAAAAIGVGLLMRQSFQAASDLQETVTKTGFVFKDMTKDVEKWAATSVESFGMSRRMALEYASTFGNLLTSFKLTNSAAVQMSTTMVGLSADLASFNNTGTEDALYAIRAAFVGEFEPMRRYGVTLSAVRIEMEALNMGLKKKYENMTAAERATIIYNTVLKDTKNAHEDFSRTANSAANQQRIMKANMEETFAEMGQHLIPIATKAMGVINKLMESFRGLSEDQQTFVLGTGLMLVAMGPLTSAIGGVSTALGFLKTALNNTGKAMQWFKVQSLATKGALLGIVAGAGMVALHFWQKHKQAQEENRGKVEELTEALKQQNGVMNESFNTTLMSQLTENSKHVDTMSKLMEYGGGTFEEYAEAVKKGGDAFDEFRKRQKDAASAYYEENHSEQFVKDALDLLDSMDKTNGRMKAMGKEFEDLEKTGGNAYGAIDDLNGVMQTGAKTTSEYQAAVKALGADMDKFVTTGFGTRPMMDSWAAALGQASVQLKETKADVTNLTTEGIENRQMLEGLGKTVISNMQDMLESGRSLNEVSAYGDAFARSLEGVLLEAGVAKEEVARLIAVIQAWKDHTIKTLEVQVKFRASYIQPNAQGMGKGVFAPGDPRSGAAEEQFDPNKIFEEINRAIGGVESSISKANKAGGAAKEATRYLQEGALTIQQFLANVDAYALAIQQGDAAMENLVTNQMNFLGLADKITGAGISWGHFTDAITGKNGDLTKILDQMQQYNGLTDAGRTLIMELAAAHVDAQTRMADAGSFSYDTFISQRKSIQDALKADGEKIGANTKHWTHQFNQFIGLTGAIEGTSVSYEDLQNALHGTTGDLNRIIEHLIKTGRITEVQANAMRSYAETFGEAGEGIDLVTDALGELDKTLGDIYDKYFADDDAMGRWASGLKNIAQEISDSAATVGGVKGAGAAQNPAIAGMIRDLAAGGIDDLAKMAAEGKSAGQIQEFASKFQTDLKGLMRDSGLSGMTNEVMSYFAEALAAILGSVPQLSGGGYIKRDGLAMLHKDEMVVPLERGGPGGTTNVYITAEVPISADRGKVARELYDLVAMHSRRGNKLVNQ